MAPLRDPRIQAAFNHALEQGLRFSGYVTWRPRAQEWVRTELPNVTLKAIAELMYQHVHSGGEIDQVRETREPWLDFQFHYDLRLTVDGRRIYVETILLSEDPDDPEIQVVNIHDA
jgi:hypothetical protein